MKFTRSILLSFLLAPALAFGQTTAPATAPAPNPLIDAVLTAPDPSATVEAYVRGTAADPNNVELGRAYVRHMVELGAPEMADAQAHDLVKRGKADALARGVAAYNDAARGNAPAAVENLRSALSERADDPFLLRTAGQVVAWYDGQTDRSSLSKDDVTAIEWMRTNGSGRQEFTDAYRMATEARRQSPGTPQQPAAADSSTTVAPAASPTVSAPATYYYSYPADDTYVGSSGYRYYDPYYGYSGYAYWPSYSILVIRDCDFDRRRHHGHWGDGHWVDRRSGSIDRGGRDGWRDGGRDGGGRWNSRDGVLTRPDGWMSSSSSQRNFVGPLPVNPGSSRDTGGRARGASVTIGRSAGNTGRSSGDSGSVRSSPPQSGSRSNASRSSPAPTPKYDTPAPQAPSRSASPAPKSGGGGGDRGGGSKSSGSSSSSSGDTGGRRR